VKQYILFLFLYFLVLKLLQIFSAHSLIFYYLLFVGTPQELGVTGNNFNPILQNNGLVPSLLVCTYLYYID